MITPTIGGRVGVLAEEGFVGEVAEGTAGLGFRVGAAGSGGSIAERHSYARGPHPLLIGYQAAL
jgi:hypothetical protein